MTARCEHGIRWFRCRTCGEKWVPWAAEHLALVETDGLLSGAHVFDGAPFFSTGPVRAKDLFEWAVPQPLTAQTFLQARTNFYQRYIGRHLRLVGSEPDEA